MMKFDTVEVTDRLAGQDELAAAMGLEGNEPLWVAGGTGPGEEDLLLDVYRRLREEHAKLRLAIVPRKPERFEEVARLIEQKNLPCIRRSRRPNETSESAPADAVLLGDTMGELRKFYALAEVVFVGRSLVPMGGSDMIEAAALGKPTCFGPHTFNFPQADDLSRHGCRRVEDANELEARIDAWLGDPAAADKAGRSAQQYVRSQQGATRRNVELICRLLGREPALREGDIATETLHPQPDAAS
jgi:3-deoxy-D-manno-octulosonic-acid transferase